MILMCVGAYQFRDFTPVHDQIVEKGQRAQAHGIRVCSDSLKLVLPTKQIQGISAMPFSGMSSHITFTDTTGWQWTCLVDTNGKIMTFRR